jgi:hypothetical protein
MVHEEVAEPFETHRELDGRIAANLADIVQFEVNGTPLKVVQYNRTVPILLEVYVGSESDALGAFNVATGETTTLGGVDEALAQRVDEMRDLPLDEIPAALDALAYRLNPSGRDEPATDRDR